MSMRLKSRCLPTKKKKKLTIRKVHARWIKQSMVSHIWLSDPLVCLSRVDFLHFCVTGRSNFFPASQSRVLHLLCIRQARKEDNTRHGEITENRSRISFFFSYSRMLFKLHPRGQQWKPRVQPTRAIKLPREVFRSITVFLFFFPSHEQRAVSREVFLGTIVKCEEKIATTTNKQQSI